MLKQETIMAAFLSRVSQASGITYAARNPSTKPAAENMPLVNVFDFRSRAIESAGASKSKAPTTKFEFAIGMELFVAGTDESEASEELMEQLKIVFKAIYTDGASLGGLCLILVSDIGQIIRPPIGGNVAAIGVVFKVQYVEDFNNL